jgi:hypothetical protein
MARQEVIKLDSGFGPNRGRRMMLEMWSGWNEQDLAIV